MDLIAAAAISAASGLLGALIGAGTTFAAQRAERRSRERDALHRELAAVSSSLDMLLVRIKQMPRDTTLGTATEAVFRKRLPNLNFLLDRIYEKTLGRDAFRSVEEVTQTLNRAMLIAPDEVRRALARLADLLATVSSRDDEWEGHWRDACGDLARASAHALSDGKKRPRRARIGTLAGL